MKTYDKNHASHPILVEAHDKDCYYNFPEISQKIP